MFHFIRYISKQGCFTRGGSCCNRLEELMIASISLEKARVLGEAWCEKEKKKISRFVKILSWIINNKFLWVVYTWILIQIGRPLGSPKCHELTKDNEKKKRFNSRRKSFDRVARQFKNKLRSRLNRLDLNYEKRRFHSLQHNFRSHPNGTKLFTKQELKNDWDISRGHHTNSDSGGSDRTVVWPSTRSKAPSMPMFWRFRFSLEMRAEAAGVTEPSFDHQYGRRPCRCRCFDGFDFPWKWERQRREWQNRRLTINTVGGPVDADVLTVSIFLGNESGSGGSDRTVVWPSIRSEALSVPMFWRFRFSLEMRAAAAGVTEPSFDHQYGRRPCRCWCFDGLWE